MQKIDFKIVFEDEKDPLKLVLNLFYYIFIER